MLDVFVIDDCSWFILQNLKLDKTSTAEQVELAQKEYG